MAALKNIPAASQPYKGRGWRSDIIIEVAQFVSLEHG
jgi:hypothetical protein